MAALPVLVTSPATAQQAASCRIMHALNENEGPTSRISLLDLPAMAEQPLPSIGYWVNALGYSAAQDLVYSVADGDKKGRFHDGGHVLTIDRTGKTADLGPVRKIG